MSIGGAKSEAKITDAGTGGKTELEALSGVSYNATFGANNPANTQYASWVYDTYGLGLNGSSAWTNNLNYSPAQYTPPTVGNLSQQQLEERANKLYDRFSDDGFLWTSSSTGFDEIKDALSGLNDIDRQNLISLYNEKYSPKRDGHDLFSDLTRELDNPYDRFRAFQLLQPQNIQNQALPTSQGGHNPGILMDPPVKEVVPGSKITYSGYLGEVIYDPDKPPKIRSFVINDPAAVKDLRDKGIDAPDWVQGPDGVWKDAQWDFAGKHTLVYEIQWPGQPPQYYTYEQIVRNDLDWIASEALQKQGDVKLSAEVYLTYLQLQIDQLKNQKDAVFYKDDIHKLEDAKANAQKLLLDNAVAPPIPLQATLVPKEKPQAIPLQLYLKPLANGKWAVVDITNPSPDAARTYESDSPKGAWDEFIKNNNLPAGQIAARAPQLPQDYPIGQNDFPKFGANEVWNEYSDGKSDFKHWAENLSVVSIVTGIGAVVILLIPGVGEGALLLGGGLLLTSGATGLASSGLSIYDRVRYGNFQWNAETALDIVNIAGSFAVGAGGVISLGGKVLTAERLGQAVIISEGLNKGSNAASGIVLGAVYYDQIQKIQQDSNLSDSEKSRRIQQILQTATLAGGLIILGFGGRGSTVLDETAVNSLNDTLAQSRLQFPQLVDDIANDPILQRVLVELNYDVPKLGQLQAIYNSSGATKTFSEFLVDQVSKGFTLENLITINQTIQNAQNLDPQLLAALQSDERLQMALVNTNFNLDELQTKWLAYRQGVLDGKLTSPTFADYLTKVGVSVSLNGDRRLVTEVIANWDNLTTSEKQLEVLKVAEPRLAAALQDPASGLSKETRDLINSILNRDVVGSSTTFSTVRGNLSSELNEVLGKQITNPTELQTVLSLINEPGSRGAIGEYYYGQLAANAGDSLTRKPNIRRGDFDTSDPARLDNNFQPDFFQPSTNRTLDVKVGYDGNDIDVSQINDYMKLRDASLRPGSPVNQQFGQISGHDYLFLPNGSSNPQNAAAQAYQAINKENPAYINRINLYYMDTDGIIYRFEGPNIPPVKIGTHLP